MKLKNISYLFIRIFLILLIAGIVILNLSYFSLDNSNLMFTSVMLLIILFIIMWLYKREFISKRVFYILLFCYLFLGIGIRVYLIENLHLNLYSDFKYVYDNAELIIDGDIKIGSYYLSYNGYSYIFSYILAVIFKIFGTSVKVALYFNLACQLLSVFLLYKIINLKAHKETASVLSIIYFLLPTIIFSNLLIATETQFFLMFFLTIYAYYKIISKKDLKLKNFLLFALLGILICLTNYVRPVMNIFLIALVIIYILNLKKVKELLLLLVLLGSYSICNTGINAFIEKGIGTETRSGALGWSIYFGSNYDTCGSWSPEDSKFINKVLEDPNKGDKDLIIFALDRLEDYGFKKTSLLLGCKYRNLWINNVGTWSFVNDMVNVENSSVDFASLDAPTSSISSIIVIFFGISTIACVIIEQRKKEHKWIFLELFGLGYILSNFLVCLNGRYNIPLYPILIICSATLFEYLLISKKTTPQKKDITKIKNKNPKVLLIVPAYNEEASIEKTIKTITKSNYDYIIINDGSKDKTLEICEKNNYNYISLPFNLGIGGAVQTGYKYALKNNYDIAVQYDADGQHDINSIKSLIKPIVDNKAHFVIGSRFIDKTSSAFKSTKMRRFGIHIISKLIYFFSKQRIYDTTSGFRAANIDVIKRFSTNYPAEYPEPISDFEVLNEGYIIKEVPVLMHERTGGASSIVSWKKAYYMLDVIISLIIIQIRGGEK